MAINFGQYVYKPRPLQNWDYAEGIRDLATARRDQQKINNQDRQATESLAETTAGRNDLNTRYAAEMAQARSKEDAARINAKYEQQLGAISSGRQSALSGDYAGARSFGARAAELGGQFSESPGQDPAHPNFSFQAGQAPGSQPLDVQGMRQNIFGGGGMPSSPPGSFDMQSNVGPGSQPLSPGQNMFDRLPGSSAAAAPPPPQAQPQAQPPAAGPPPGPAAPDPATLEQFYARQPEAPPQQPQQQPPQAGSVEPQRNPMQPPAFDPYRINTGAVTRENQARVQPMLDAMTTGVPESYKGRVAPLAEAAGKMGYGPADTLKLTDPTFKTLASLMRSDMQAEAARSSLGLRAETSANTRNDRIMDRAKTRATNVAKIYDVANQAKRWMQIPEARDLLNAHNKTADTSAIATIFRLYQSGIITDKDFANLKSGASKTLGQAIKDGIWENLIENGINPDTRAELTGMLNIALEGTKRNFNLVQDQMLSTVTHDRNASSEEREAYINATAELVPTDLWSPTVQQGMNLAMPQKSGSMDQSGNYPVSLPPPEAGDNLGVMKLPEAFDVRASSNSSSRSRGTPAKRITRENAKEASPMELMNRLKAIRGDK